MSGHALETCKKPRITRTFKRGAMWGCPACGKLWLAKKVPGWDSYYWAWRELPRFDEETP